MSVKTQSGQEEESVKTQAAILIFELNQAKLTFKQNASHIH